MGTLRMLAVVMVALLLALSCSADFSLYEVMQGQIPGGPVQISPVQAFVAVDQTCDFSASGGSPPYRFAVISGGGIIDADSGNYKAPLTPDSAQIQVMDSKGAVSPQATVTIGY